MDLTEARSWVAKDTREGDPERWAGRSDDEVLASLPEDGVDLAEVQLWANDGILPEDLLHAYVMVIEGSA